MNVECKACKKEINLLKEDISIKNKDCFIDKVYFAYCHLILNENNIYLEETPIKDDFIFFADERNIQFNDEEVFNTIFIPYPHDSIDDDFTMEEFEKIAVIKCKYIAREDTCVIENKKFNKYKLKLLEIHYLRDFLKLYPEKKAKYSIYEFLNDSYENILGFEPTVHKIGQYRIIVFDYYQGDVIPWQILFEDEKKIVHCLIDGLVDFHNDTAYIGNVIN